MTITVRIPGLRSLALVFAGTVLGASVVAPVLARDADSVEPMAVQTRVASCSAMNFLPIDSETAYGSVAGRRYRVGTNGEGYFTCDPNIPHRAVVTAVRFTVWDNSAAAEVRNCALLRHGLTPTTASTFNLVGQVAPTGVAETPGVVRRTAPAITNATVNLSLYAYLLQCEIAGNGAVSIYGASVTYTIDAANG
jgi:hypothetical protein